MKKKKVNKYAHLAEPQASFDFHGRGVLVEHDICSLAEDFLEEQVRKGNRLVSIIVGKGIHSSDGPVIGPLLRRHIPSLPYVWECKDAPYTRGGSGALEILLHIDHD